MPYFDPSRPRPDCFMPPNGADGSETMPRLMPMDVAAVMTLGERTLILAPLCVAEQTVAEALANAGVEVPVSCGQGICGTCLVRVLEGEVAAAQRRVAGGLQFLQAQALDDDQQLGERIGFVLEVVLHRPAA